LLLNGFVMLGMQIRSEWLAFAIGVVIWCMLTRQAKRLLQAGAILASLLTLMYITDFSLPSPKGRAEGDFSSTQLADRAMAVFRADLSDESAAAGLGGVDSQEATLCSGLFGGWRFGIRSLGFSNGGLGAWLRVSPG